MMKRTKFALGVGTIFLVTVTIIVVQVGIVPPSHAGSAEIGVKKGDKIVTVQPVDIIQNETIQFIRVIDTGGTTWCDVFAGIPHPSTIEEITEYKAMSTDDPMIQALLAAAHASKIKVTVRGHKISKPAGRQWPSKVVLFYKITEVTGGPFVVLYPI